MSAHKAKKRKTQTDGEQQRLDTSKPSAIFKPAHGRMHTLSIALPGSIIANAVTHDQKNSLAGQVARAIAVFCVDEVVIFDDGQADIREPEQGGYTAFADANFFLYHLLTYLETPPHLRKALFPMHPDLRTAGALPSLDMPHHLRSDEWCDFREGITLGPVDAHDVASGTLVECGLTHRVVIPDQVENNCRVTLRLPNSKPSKGNGFYLGEAVSPATPREKSGYYWGYSVRSAASLSSVFTECPYHGGYDVSIGTSERGVPVSSILDSRSDVCVDPSWNHLLIVFGGVAGLEVALGVDEELQTAGLKQVEDLFDRWVNLVPGQGSRTIRTEEAIWVGLTSLRGLVDARDAAP